MKKKTVKKVKMHKFLVCECNSQDFAQGQKKFAWSHNRMTARFRNSVLLLLLELTKTHSCVKEIHFEASFLYIYLYTLYLYYF